MSATLIKCDRLIARYINGKKAEDYDNIKARDGVFRLSDNAEDSFDGTPGVYIIDSSYTNGIEFPEPSTLGDFIGREYTFLPADAQAVVISTSLGSSKLVLSDEKNLPQETITVRGASKFLLASAANVTGALIQILNLRGIFTDTSFTDNFDEVAGDWNLQGTAAEFDDGAGNSTLQLLDDANVPQFGSAWLATPYINSGNPFDKSFSAFIRSDVRFGADGFSLVFQNASNTDAGENNGYGASAGEYVSFHVQVANGGGGSTFLRVMTTGDVQTVAPNASTLGAGNAANTNEMRIWIDYDAETTQMDWFLDFASSTTKPSTPVHSVTLDIDSFFTTGDPVYVGFVGDSNGGAGEFGEKRINAFELQTV